MSLKKSIGAAEKFILHNRILDKWKGAIYDGNFNDAIQLDFFHYEKLVKITEDVTFWDRWQFDTHETRQRLTKRVIKSVPSRFCSLAKQSNRFAIVHHNYSGLAHEVQLSRNIQFIRAAGHELDFDIIYLFDSVPNAIESASTLYKISQEQVILLSGADYRTVADRLHLALIKKDYVSVIYPSIFMMAFWMSLFNTHGNQKFLQMKYYPSQSGRISQWAGGRRDYEDTYEINGFQFLQLEALDLNVDLADVSKAPSAKPLRGLTFGSISRPEKVADSAYNEFVAMILSERPNSNYLYAGREQTINVIPHQIRSNSNALHIGWVNPAEAIHQYCIYLEPFPWGGGDMTLLALRAGLPYLTLATEENSRFGILGFIRLIATGGPDILQLSFCSTVEELRERLLALMDDPALRDELGCAWRTQIAAYAPSDVQRWVDFLLT